jgi:hypothetical protein
MRRQHLIERAPAGTMLEAVEAVHGIQAQIQAHAYFAVAQRVDGLSAADVDRALWTDKSLIKTWAMRGTVHWLPASEEPMFRTGLFQIRRDWIDRNWRSSGLPLDQRQLLFDAVLDALADGPLGRQEIAARVVPRIGAWAEPYLTESWGGIYHTMCQYGLVVFGPSTGTNVTFARRDSWDTLPAVPDDPAAPAELIRRYLRSFGPATVQDVTYWLGANLRNVLPVWKQLGDEIVPVETEGKTRWLLAGDVDALKAMDDATLPVRLIPAFDPLLLAPRDKSELLDMRFHKVIYGIAAWVHPAVIVDGRVVAKWSYERKANHVVFTIQPFTRLNKRLLPAIRRDANHLARAIGREATVCIADS